MGYSTLLIPDHFGEQLGPIAALMCAACATTRLRIGSLVFDNDFRHPVVLAKEAATLDLLSEGRLELGMGAGWLKSEYDSAGLDFEGGASRVARLEEAVRLIKALFSESPATFAGLNYRVEGLNGQPKPIQKPHPPILVGGGGKRLLSLAAQEADIVGVAPRALRQGGLQPSSLSSASVAEQVDWIKGAAGPRFGGLELHMLIQAVEITDDRARRAEEMSRSGDQPSEWFLDSPHFLIGTLEEICASLEDTRERHGISYFSVHEVAVERFAPVVRQLAGR